MAHFDTPTVNETGDMFELFSFINNKATEGLFFPVILLTIWLISFIGAIAEGRSASRAWIFSSFISAILGGLLVLLGFLSANYVFFLVLNIAFGIVWIYLSESKNN